uniref:Uncharacterized protein n=1 Tax=viral metagenome TaxID=1070528 RepID=A0A6M3LRJ8_9ZZZZ
MHQNKTTGLFHFDGDEHEDVMRYIWTCFMDLSWHGMLETILRIIFKKPPKWVGYEKPDIWRQRALNELNRMAGT